VLDRINGFRMLLVFSHRQEFESTCTSHRHVTGLALPRLTSTQSSAMVSWLVGKGASRSNSSGLTRLQRPGQSVARRSLGFYDAVGKRLARNGRPA
jgi:hypothetical protein